MAYIYSNVKDLADTPVVGTRQCVALVQHFALAPTTARWRQGDIVMGNADIKAGTAIATFVKGRYPNQAHGNHAALYVGPASGGMYIADQWRADNKTKISIRLIRSQGKGKDGRYIDACNNADAFSVIE